MVLWVSKEIPLVGGEIKEFSSCQI